jgi:hypothetical protein
MPAKKIHYRCVWLDREYSLSISGADPQVYEVLRLDRNSSPSDRIFLIMPPGSQKTGFTRSTRRSGGLQRAFQGMQVVVHLAADPGAPGVWQSARE